MRQSELLYHMTELRTLSDGSSGFTTEELKLLRIVGRGLSLPSILGSAIVIFLFFFLKSIRSFALELIVWLCFSEIIYSITVYFPLYESDNIQAYLKGDLSFSCKAQALINIFADLSSLIWTTIMGYTAFTSMSDQEFLENNRTRYRISFIIAAVGFPLLFTLIVLISEAYGPSGVFCWITTDYDSAVIHLMATIYFVSLWIIIAFNCFCIVKIVLFLKHLTKEEEIINKYISKLKWYPIVQIIIYFPCTLTRIYELVTMQPSFTLTMTEMIFDSLAGLAFSIVYGFNGDVRNAILDIMNGWFCWKKHRDSATSKEVLDSTSVNSEKRERLFRD